MLTGLRRRRSEAGDFNVLWALGLAIMILFLRGMSTDLWRRHLRIPGPRRSRCLGGRRRRLKY
jgi:hypothetical protein